jgi:hypothetical protein
MSVTSFSPEKHGFRFSNNDIEWSFGPFSGKTLCGGLSYAAMDYFNYGMCIPQVSTAPPEGTVLQKYVYDRQMTAHGNTIPDFASAYTTPFPDLVKKSIPLVPKLDALLSTIGPTIICLTGIAKGHHVVAIGCTPGAFPEIQMYDSNFPTMVSKLKLMQASATLQRWKHSVSGEFWYGFFIDSGYSKKLPPALSGEPDWRWCHRCEGLFWNGDASDKGKCPAGGAHVAGGVRNYILAINAGSGQANWKWCKRCQGLWFSGNGSPGKCPAGGSHDAFDKNQYFMAQNTGAGEGNWRWCKRCEGMFWAGNPVKGKCPAGGSHDPSGSGNYFLMATNVAN